MVAVVALLAGCASVSGTYDGYRSDGVNAVCRSTVDDRALVEVTLESLKPYHWLMSVNAEGDSVHIDRIGVLPSGMGLREGEVPPSLARLKKLLQPGNDDDNPFESFQQAGLRSQPQTGPFSVVIDVHWGNDSARLTALRLHWSNGEPAFLQHLKLVLRPSDCSL